MKLADRLGTPYLLGIGVPNFMRLSRREQHGWTGARNANQANEIAVCVPSRREAVRREQARRVTTEN